MPRSSGGLTVAAVLSLAVLLTPTQATAVEQAVESWSIPARDALNLTVASSGTASQRYELYRLFRGAPTLVCITTYTAIYYAVM